MAIAQFSFGSPNDKLSSIQQLERGTRLNSRPVEGTPCRFRTCYPVDLMPLEMLGAALESPAPKDARGKYADCSIRFSFRCFGDANLSELQVGTTGEPPRSL
ncbi:type VI secretion system baseplate subunit TssF, partial [Escherichia coli]|nr:type VI secretion system baseplate subunit TssF [Escherichia coli]